MDTLQPSMSYAEMPAKPLRSSDLDVQYRTVSRAAIGSVVLFLLGLTAIMFPVLVILPIAGLLLGFSGYRSIRRYPDEYTGLRLAYFGMTSCLLLAAGSITYHSYVYATEVPPNHIRVLFSELQPESKAKAAYLPKRAIELRGEKIFIKGYMHPGVSGMGKVNQFVLVPDMGTCCFGGQPAPTDMILVHTTDEARVAYAARSIKLAGEFDVGEQAQNFGDVKNVVYRLEAYKPEY